jgi:hypothetical protein
LQKQKESQNTRFCRSGRQNITLKKLQKLQKYQIAEVEGKSKYQILQKRKTKYHSIFFFFAETEHKYQIAEIEEKMKY